MAIANKLDTEGLSGGDVLGLLEELIEKSKNGDEDVTPPPAWVQCLCTFFH